MNFKNYRSLSIDGHLLDGNEIVEYCLRQQQENVRQLGSFVKDWLGDGETITLQTSGSTGVPRQITVDKDQMLQSAAMTAAFFGFKRNDNALLCLPVNYVAGKMMIVRAFYSGLNLVCIEPQSAPLEAVDNDMKIEFAPLVPLQLMNSAATKSVQKILLGGAALSPVLEEKCQRLKADIYHGYGMTETLSHVAIRKINGENRSAIFDALPGISFQIDDRQCLIIHVPFLKGEIVTNDVVELLNSHQFIWKGRADFVVNSGGVKLFPEEIEKKIFAISSRYFA